MSCGKHSLPRLPHRTTKRQNHILNKKQGNIFLLRHHTYNFENTIDQIIIITQIAISCVHFNNVYSMEVPLNILITIYINAHKNWNTYSSALPFSSFLCALNSFHIYSLQMLFYFYSIFGLLGHLIKIAVIYAEIRKYY